MQVLERIVAKKREAVAQRMAHMPLDELKRDVVPTQRDLLAAIKRSPCAFITECKHASPSAGVLREDYDPAAIAREYADVATAISVITDEPFFQGSLDDLRRVRQAVDCPVLCKDFVVDPYQIYEARAHGADAVLLMLSVLSPTEVSQCLEVVRSLQMTALVEVHDETELRDALRCKARLIGINNRDLKTLKVSLTIAEALAPLVPADVALISESGIGHRSDVRRLRPSVDGFLVGSSLMRRDDVGMAVRELAYGRVKICGLTRPEDARCVWACGAMMGGMIFVPQSPRCITIDQAQKLREAAPLHWVGVFVNESNEVMANIAHQLQLSAVQLHGDESQEQAAALRPLLPSGCALWKAHRVRDAQLPDLADYGADHLLLDTFSKQAYGGTGHTFDWRCVAEHPQRDAMIVAGGISPENVLAADSLGAWALDVNSGVEQRPGIKDPDKLRCLFAALRAGEVRRADRRGGGDR